MEAYDKIEQSLGISEYFSPSSVSGFSAVVKARYSDFLVHEIDLDGNIAKLTSLEVPKSEPTPASSEVEKTTEVVEESKPPAPTKDGTEETPAAKDDDNNKMEVEKESNQPSLAEFEPQLTKLIDNTEISKNVIQLLESHNKAAATPEGGEAPTEKFVTLPALEKQQRKAVHEWVRNSLKCGRADTLDGKIRIWHSKFEKEMPNYKAFGNTHKKRKPSDRALKKKARVNWPSDRPDFLRFTLYKENCDTTTATREIGRRGSRIGYAGMKDKRGITTQFCTMYRTLPEQIARGNQHQRRGGGGNTKQKGYSVVHIGNFEYVSKELRLGSLKGNRFDIILRNVKLLDEDGSDNTAKRKQVLEQAAQSMKDKGFINYFGTQRFGKFNNTHLVGIAVLQGYFEKAVNILMEPNSEDRPYIDRARKEWKDRFTYGKTKENESSAAKRVLKRYGTAKLSFVMRLMYRIYSCLTFFYFPKLTALIDSCRLK